jgi:hypothetical protein
MCGHVRTTAAAAHMRTRDSRARRLRGGEYFVILYRESNNTLARACVQNKAAEPSA